MPATINRTTSRKVRGRGDIAYIGNPRIAKAKVLRTGQIHPGNLNTTRNSGHRTSTTNRLKRCRSGVGGGVCRVPVWRDPGLKTETAIGP